MRIFNNNKSHPKVDIYSEKKAIALNLIYGDYTSYLLINDSHHNISVKIRGNDTAIVTTHIVIKDGHYYTAIISDDMTIHNDDLTCPDPGYANIRCITSPDVHIDNIKVTKEYTPIRINKSKYKLGTTTNCHLISGGIYTVISTKDTIIVCHDNENKDGYETLQDNLNLQKYMGKWHQIATMDNETLRHRVDVEYTLLHDRINIFQTHYDKDWHIIYTSDESSTISSNPAVLRAISSNPAVLTATSPNPAVLTISNGKLLIHATDYVSYAIIGSPTRDMFYLLSRDAKVSVEDYKEFLRYAQTLGYNKQLIRNNYHTITRETKGLCDSGVCHQVYSS